MAAHHHLPPLTGTSAAAVRAPGAGLAGARDATLWLLAAPLAFYLAWQALYWLAVQVVGRRYVCANKLDTSYRCLARRAQRANNVWARIVLQGSTARRLVMYGLLQLAFTGAGCAMHACMYACMRQTGLALWLLPPLYYTAP